MPTDSAFLQYWQSWPVERVVYVFLAAAYLLVWGQVTLLHWRGGFRSIYMWGPVVYTPVLILATLLLALFRAHFTELLFVIVFTLGAVEGAFGAYKHIGGVRSHVGGFTLRNQLEGPPWLLPVTYMALALFGLLIHYWHHLHPQALAALGGGG